MYLMTVCQNCQLEKYKCKCPNMTQKGKYWEEQTKRFYTWEELRAFYKSKEVKKPE